VATLLPYLQDERHIDLMESEFDDLSSSLSDSRGGTVFVLVAAHKNWTGDLDPAKYSDDELRGWVERIQRNRRGGMAYSTSERISFRRLTFAYQGEGRRFEPGVPLQT
jgi:hypothetical protein